jgi:hypothetical protein
MILTALQENFEDVFSCKNTVFYDNEGEYFVRDSKFGFEGHTFIKVGDIDQNDVRLLFSKRIKFLVRKFLEDISEGGFIFLYYFYKSAMQDYDELIKLSKALSPKQNNFLLVLETPNKDLIENKILSFTDFLMIGNKDRFVTFNSKPYIYMDSWRKICANALRCISRNRPDWTNEFFIQSTECSKSGKLSNLAFGRYATQSSILPWATSESPNSCAPNAVDGVPSGMPNVHTNLEDNPWWLVDLGAIFAIHEIRIYNRLDDIPSLISMTKLKIDAALSRAAFEEIFRLDTDQSFGGIDGRYMTVNFEIPVVAQRLRIQLTQRGYLHLDQVYIFGKSSPYEVDAFGKLAGFSDLIERRYKRW